jgi:hypothetical protein
MVAVRKRTRDDINFFEVISGHEHRSLAPTSTLALAEGGWTLRTYFRQCKRIEKAAISISVQIPYCLSVSPRSTARDCEISKGNMT